MEAGSARHYRSCVVRGCMGSLHVASRFTPEDGDAEGYAPQSFDERTRNMLLSYLAQPGFAGERLAEQVLGPARLELLQLSDREVYFAVPQPDQTGQTFDAIIARFVVDPKRIVLAEDDGAGRLRLGKYSLRRSENKHYFFKTAVDNVKFDPQAVLEFHFVSGIYKLDMRELERLCPEQDYLRRTNARADREKPSGFARPNEVLMTGVSDCSNKAILLGSLLEQLGEDYLFVYTPDHITVAVKQGDFPARNGLSLEWEGQTWLIAEGTVPGSRIGVDRLQEEERLKQFLYVQRPRDRDVIFDLATGKQLLFQ